MVTFFSIAAGANLSIRAYPIIQSGRIVKASILATNAAGTGFSKQNLAISILLNAFNTPRGAALASNGQSEFITNYNLDIPVFQGWTLGLDLNNNANNIAMTVVIEQEID